MARKTIFAEGELYHLYNRGTEKRPIFSAKKDYERFAFLLFACNGTKPVHVENLLQTKSKQGSTLLGMLEEVERGEPLVDIGGYCLMPNHFHLLVRETKRGGISRFMQKLSTAYTMYYNLRHERTGALFGGKFKAAHVSNDRYLSYLIAYIHLNPVKLIEPKWKERGITNKKRAEEYLRSYHHSSYLDFLNQKRVENCILNKSALPDYFETPRDFKAHVSEWLRPKQGRTLLKRVGTSG